MRNHDVWRELYRCGDLAHARAVATAIAAMEFDVRLRACEPLGRRSGDTSEAGAFNDPFSDDWEASDPCDPPGRGWSFVVEVSQEHWGELTDVLPEIVAEQVEFDAWVESKRGLQRPRMLVVVGAATLAELAVIWRLLEG